MDKGELGEVFDLGKGFWKERGELGEAFELRRAFERKMMSSEWLLNWEGFLKGGGELV